MSNIEIVRKNLGPVTAYKYAVQQGYTGTEQEFAALMASYATVAEEAESAKDDAVDAKTAAEAAQAAAEAAAEQAEGAIEVDDTLSVNGRAADAKKTGDEITSLKSGYLQIEPPKVSVSISPIDGKLINTSTLAVTANGGFEYADVPVTPGDTLYISGYATIGAAYDPAYYNDNNAFIAYASSPTSSYEDVETIVPIGATRLIINGRPSADKNIIIKKVAYSQASEDFLDDYNNRTRRQFGVSLALDGTCDIYSANYADNEVLRTRVAIKQTNNLPDVYGMLVYSASSGDVPIEDTTRLRFIVNGATDFISPCILYAVNNVDGDFPDFTSGKLTGGWHGYNSQTTDASATARNILYKVYCDGNEVQPGNKMRGNSVEVHITNRLQASNTEKENGTGREVAEFSYRLCFTQNGLTIDGTIKALEEIEIQLLYGISCRNNLTDVPIYFIGSRTRRGGFLSTQATNSGDKNAYSINQVGTDIFSMGAEPSVDLGAMYANYRPYSILLENGKSYMVLISDNGERSQRFTLDTNQMAFFKGYYSAYKA